MDLLSLVHKVNIFRKIEKSQEFQNNKYGIVFKNVKNQTLNN